MAQKPSIPKGTRDFGFEEMARRNYIFDTIRSVFALHGFRQIETPAMENLSTLTGKYGEEGDRLLFRILNSGDFMRGIAPEDFANDSTGKLAARICEKGLRYDLTVPFARYVAQHRDELTMPLRRYQMQPVWRADRPQKGRYREFCQCDADVVGSDSLLSEVELAQILDSVFLRLGVRVSIRLNNRKILAGLAELIGETDKLVPMTVAMDKLDKIGAEGVMAELRASGFGEDAIGRLLPIMDLTGTVEQKLAEMERRLAGIEVGLKGLREVEFVTRALGDVTLSNEVALDLTLARGLDYYTGCIFEVRALDAQIGSVAGGGRYDNLTGVFGMQGLSGVGVSFGADRIYDVLAQQGLFPEGLTRATRLLFVNFGQEEALHCLPLMAEIRSAGISCELYPDTARMKKQMQYANDMHIPYVALVGETEMREGKVTLRDMETGEQRLLTAAELTAAMEGA